MKKKDIKKPENRFQKSYTIMASKMICREGENKKKSFQQDQRIVTPVNLKLNPLSPDRRNRKILTWYYQFFQIIQKHWVFNFN